MDNHSSNYSSILSELFSKGNKSFDPSNVRYVCHTSTIPLATTVDEQAILKRLDKGCVEVSHSIQYQPGMDVQVDYRCCKIHCMYFSSRTGYGEKEVLRENCPCNFVVHTQILPDGEEIDRYLQPLCFIQVLKEMRYKFGYRDQTQCESGDECCHNDHIGNGPHSNRPKIDFAEIMFCQNSQAVTDSSYSRPLRDVVGFSGWENAKTPELVSRVLNQLYWYNKFVSDKTMTLLSAHAKRNFKWFKQALTQTLHTVNGQIVKKFLLFPCEMENYVKLAKLTAVLFEDVIRDYLKQADELLEPNPSNSVFVRMKEIMKLVKRSFCSEDRSVRLSCFDVFTDKSCGFSRFWGGTFKRLNRRVTGMDEDYTLSPIWIVTMSGFAQTRNLGYLPQWVAEFKRKEFRNVISRPKLELPADELRLIGKLVAKRCYEAGIEKNFLTSQNRETNRDFREVISNLKIPLKPSASNISTVAAGGKTEDARMFFNDAIDNKWRIPVRDFATGRSKGFVIFREELRDERPGYEDYLFWAAFQVLLNHMAKEFPDKFENYAVTLPNSEYWEASLWKMQIVHISEPGKDRNLTKTSSLVAWVLTVASKVCQSVLAFAQDHTAGLILSAQDWMHQKRISAESFESEWLYDPKTRRLIPEVWNGFQDWTESTDFIARQVGSVALLSFMTWIDFPKFFGKIVLLAAKHDYQVTEVVGTSYEEGVMTNEVVSTVVTEGYMMSMPLTKCVLHLMHDVNIGLANEIIKLGGVQIAPRVTQSKVDAESMARGAYQLIPDEELLPIA